MRSRTFIVGMALTFAGSGLGAQQVAVPPDSVRQATVDQLALELHQQQRRIQIHNMESALINAVRRAGGVLASQTSQILPNLLLYSGTPRAHGFPVEGHVLFDVEIPVIRPSSLMAYFVESRLPKPSAPAPQTVGGGAAGERTRANSGVASDPMLNSPVAAGSLNPDKVYTDAVREQLVDTMLDYSRSLSIAEHESLTIVARGADVGNQVLVDYDTIIFSVKGSDLAAYHAGKLTKEEARKRVLETRF